jgi:nucleoside-diphosphate-sugar epimerase
MPDTELIALTGSNGFLGGAVLRAALAQRLPVRALLRTTSRLAYPAPGLSQHAVGLDLSTGLIDSLRGVSVVIHVAAVTRGSRALQLSETVDATRSLLAAMRIAGVSRLVGISSLAVYDYTSLQDGCVLDEFTPVDQAPERRSPYAHAKIKQERLFQDFGATILRPGVVYTRERLWSFALGRPLGRRLWLMVGPDAEVPLVHVDDAADAILRAALRLEPLAQPLNLVENMPPRRQHLLQALNQWSVAPRRVLPVPWALHRNLGRCVGAVHRAVGPARLPLPGLLDSRQLEAGFKPLRYSNTLARHALGWGPTRHASAELACAGAAWTAGILDGVESEG